MVLQTRPVFQVGKICTKFKTILLALFMTVPLGIWGCSVNSAKNHFVLAEKLWTDGKYAAAVSEFEKVASRDPKGPLGLQATYRAATTEAYFLSRYSDAVRKFRIFVDASGNTEAAWEAEKQIGDILFSKMELYDQAAQHYAKMLKQRPQAPESPEFLFRIAKSRFYLFQFDEAVRLFRKVRKDYPGTDWSEKAAYEIGVTYFTRGGQHSPSYQDAIDAYQDFIKRYPKSEWVPQARFGIASCLEELDQLDAAFHAYEALRSTYPDPNVIEIKLSRIRDRKAQRSR